jgi:hypothetical protein
VHHLLHEDLVESKDHINFNMAKLKFCYIANKVDEIEKILLKKLIDNQPLTRIT